MGSTTLAKLQTNVHSYNMCNWIYRGVADAGEAGEEDTEGVRRGLVEVADEREGDVFLRLYAKLSKTINYLSKLLIKSIT